MKNSSKKSLILKIVAMLAEKQKKDPTYITSNEMFKYCKFYTGDFWKKIKHNKKAA